MSRIPHVSQQVQDEMVSKGYDPKLAYEINRLPNFAIPRTTACTILYI